MLAKVDNTEEDAFMRSFRCLFNYGFHRRGKNASLLDVVAMEYIFADKQDLHFFV